MGCIQSYFRKAAAASSQASPIDVDKQFIDIERKNEVESKNEKVPIVSEEDMSPVNDDDEENDDENAERGSIHCVEATAVRTLAASTGTVAILGTTAKYNEKVDYRRSLHEDSSTTFESKSEQSVEPEKSESTDDQKPAQEEKSQITQNGPTSIVTTAVIEARPTANESEKNGPEQVVEVHEKETKHDEVNKPLDSSIEKPVENSKPEESAESEKYLPKVVESIEKTRKDSLDKKEELKNDIPEPQQTVLATEAIKIKINEAETTPTEPAIEALPASKPKITETAQETKIPPQSSVETEDRETTEVEKTNENSEIESTSSDMVSVVNESTQKEIPQKKDSFEECQRPNRLSLGQMSIDESEQNTMEISSADDVMKNESTDLTSPESLKESFEESLTKMNILIEGKAESKEEGESSKEENAREISNTSLNTLGDDSEDDGSDLEGNVSRKNEHLGLRRFDTISSNGESSYNRVEDHNHPSVTEEPDLEETVDQKLLELDLTHEDNVFDNEELKRLKKSVRENVIQEVDDICKQAVEKTNDIMAKIVADSVVIVEQKDGEEANNISESSILSAVDSVVAEKGSDFDSLSFLDEQSDSRSVSGLVQDDGKGVKAEIQEVAAASVSSADDAQKRLQEWEQVPSGVPEEVSNTPLDVSGAVITQENISKESKNTVDSVSEDLPKPPDLEEFPPLPENLDQFDVTEDELKAVQLPGSAEGVSQSESKDLPNHEIAASKIQAGVRGYLTRKQIREQNQVPNAQQLDPLKTDLDAMDGISKDYNIQKKRMSLDSKLVDIENIRKLPKLRCTLSECVEEESENLDLDKAASKIQTTFRNYRARKSICLGDSKKILNGQSTITNKIIQESETSEKTEQNSQETTNGKVETIEEKAIEEDQKPSIEQEINANQMGSNRMAVKTFDDDPVKQAAVKIQATYRGFKTRKSIQISASAATKIQAHFRGYKVRKTIKRSSSLNDLRNSASSSCSNISSQQDLEKRVTKIQAGVRGYLVRKRHSLQNSAAAKIQMNYRRYKSRKETKPKEPADQ